MYEIIYTTRFRRSFKKCIKRGLNPADFEQAVRLLQASGKLPAEYRPHKLSGKYNGYWECHLQPDWLLIWLQDDHQLILQLIDTGTHADLF
ncbi:MAG: type II toxin-antitoxin system YafQ family toxin [Phocaeicola sp.]|nr:type II toxin-antitoxin system YafQ family toxin [Phocaeicola sp.]MDD7448538.1 type II toxin-antitoxin system YafQ family toxin [Prevotellaceae bacterium]MDY3913454.1 type II toxin-antitoxin system YafQ family toxin [Phocaeicola sp.]MDY5939789.1 type II toxin-antitoxin system YafQ family toxin [Phocaeicola sp.]